MIKIKTNNKITIIFILFTIILIILLFLSQTILFTWSPIRLGYNYFDFRKYTVFYKTNELDPIFTQLDNLIIETENEHKLTYIIKPEIIICQDNDLLTYVPWLNHKNTACGIWPKTVYISTFIINKYKNLKLSIKHELSHILLLQNYGNSACFSIWKNNEWLPEGFAVYITNGYPYYMSKKDILSEMIANGFNYNIESNDILSGKRFHDIGFSTCYSIYYHFVNYLINQNGLNVFIAFLHNSFKNPDSIYDIFLKHYNISFNTALKKFYNYLHE